MRYCSFETRKVLEKLDEYGITLPEKEYFWVELSVSRFWNTHIIKIVEQVLTGGDTAKKLEKIDAQGWAYFEKPVTSLLTPRGGAHRTEQINVEPTDWVLGCYNLVTTSLLLADINMKELAHLLVDIPPMVNDVHGLSKAIAACKAQSSRSVYYLHGVLRREYQTAQGKIREIQQQSSESLERGWSVPEDFESMDITERRELAADWQDRLNSIRISRALNNVSTSQES